MQVNAADIYRPAISGYQFGSRLYPDPATLAMAGQCGNPSYSLDHIEYTSVANNPGPTVTIYCALTDTNNKTTVLRWASFGYTQICPTGLDTSLGNNQKVCKQVDVIKEKPCQTCPSPLHGNPINLLKKEKIQIEEDFRLTGKLEFVRSYSSANKIRTIEDFSLAWRHNYSMYVYSNLGFPPVGVAYYEQINGVWTPQTPTNSLVTFAYVRRPDGTMQYFESTDQGQTWKADADVNYKLSVTLDGQMNPLSWDFVTPQNDLEKYNGRGALTSIQYASGEKINFTYSDGSTPLITAPRPGLLIKVADGFGREISLSYDGQNRLSAVTVPSGGVFTYNYDSKSNLTSVGYPDGLSKFYYYNEPAYQLKTGTGNDQLLTGIAYEISPGNIQRYATFKYDTSALPVSTEHTGGVDKYTMAFSTKKVTSPLGAVTTYGYTLFNGVYLQSSETFDDFGYSNTIQYDANGNFLKRKDFNGNVTNYTYDQTRNLELTRVEAAGTPFARTTTTEWHPTFRLPTRIAEPLRVTSWSYDAHGWLLSKTEQATTNTNGTLGFSAVLTGKPRTWQYTYNDHGQILSKNGPRTDVNDLTIFTYDEAGNLASVTNALSQTTTFSNYNVDGRVGTITDPNGTVTSLTYTQRGQLASSSVAGETTSYLYNGANKLVQVTFPNQSSITYSYDAALRLIGISDGAGNRISYTLDAMGNRIGEQITDSAGTLSRNTARVFNILGWMTQQTGGMQ